MSTHMLGFPSSFRFFASSCISQISNQHHKGLAVVKLIMIVFSEFILGFLVLGVCRENRYL